MHALYASHPHSPQRDQQTYRALHNVRLDEPHTDDLFQFVTIGAAEVEQNRPDLTWRSCHLLDQGWIEIAQGMLHAVEQEVVYGPEEQIRRLLPRLPLRQKFED